MLMCKYAFHHRYTDDLARANTDRERKEKDWTEARAELTKERARVDELRYTSEHKMSELRAAVRKAEESVSDLRTDKIRLEADCKAAQERVTLLERQLESAEARFRDALLYQQRAADTQASPGKTPGDGSPGAVRSGGGVGGAIGGEEVAVMSSRLLALESEKSALEKQLADLKIHRCDDDDDDDDDVCVCVCVRVCVCVCCGLPCMPRCVCV